MLDILITIVGGAMAIGFAMVVVAGWLGESSSLAASLWFIGAAMVVVTLPPLLVLLAAFVVRWAARAAGFLPKPLRSTEPELGWEGWRLALDGVDHEVWIPAVGPDREVLVDGAWVRTSASPASRPSFALGSHLAELTGSIDWETMIKAAPLALGGALLGFSEGGAPPMHYGLLVDGTPRPAAEHRVHRKRAAREPGPPAPQPRRHIRLDPPGR